MRKRPLGAIARYKRAIKAIRSGRPVIVSARVPPLPAHLASGALTTTRGTDGLWRVWAPPRIGPPFKPAECRAGPFDTRDDALAWIGDQ